MSKIHKHKEFVTHLLDKINHTEMFYGLPRSKPTRSHRQLHVPPSIAKGSVISSHVPPWISSVVHRLNTCATLLALSAPNLQNYEILWSSTIICTYTHHLEFLPHAVAITRHTRTEESMLMSSNVIQ